MIVARNAIIPRVNIGRTIAVARAFEKSKGRLSREQITQKIGLKPGTGGANIRVIAAKQFGLISAASQGGYMLTELGRKVASGSASHLDYLQAFRSVPAFGKMLDRFDTDPLSVPEDDVRKAFAEFGIAAGEVDRAFTIFTRSWAYITDQKANDGGTSAPAALGSSGLEAPDEGEPDPQVGAAGEDVVDTTATEAMAALPVTTGQSIGPVRAFSDIPVIRAVLEVAPSEGVAWSSGNRDAWLELLGSAVRFTFPDT